MNVKAQALLHGAAWVREVHGDDALERVLSACGPGVRDRLATASHLDWHPVGELDEFLSRLDHVLGRGDGAVAEAAGAAAARVTLGRMGVRFAFFVARPEFMMRRVAAVWRQYNDEGTMHILEFAHGRMVAELDGAPSPSWAFCASITGWLHETAVAAGLKRVVANHVECRARGGKRCLWHVRKEAAEPLPSVPPPSSRRHS